LRLTVRQRTPDPASERHLTPQGFFGSASFARPAGASSVVHAGGAAAHSKFLVAATKA
jgi:hypothetical protein